MKHTPSTFLTTWGLLLCLILAQQPNLKIPQTFGLITVTYARGGVNTEFEKFMARYAPMDCPIITEMNIVWNNEQSPEQMGVYKTAASWKRPVHFYRTPNNSMNWRYKIPKQSQAQVYFSIDDDIWADCEELTKGFRTWQANAVGQIGPIVSYGPRGFQYSKDPLKDYYTIGLVGLAFISRHFLDLYYADLWELEQMRKVVTQKNNCDDIGLNWLIQYYYPELQTITISGTLRNISPRVAQSTSATHYPYRSQCVTLFTEIFGINALRYQPLAEHYPGSQRRNIPLKNKTVLAKKEYFQMEVLHMKNKSNGNLAALLLPDTKPTTSQQSDPQLSNVKLETQLAEARLAEINLMVSKDELKDKVTKCEQSLSEMKKIGGRIVKPTNTDYNRQTGFQQNSRISIYLELILIGLAVFFIFSKARTTYTNWKSESPHINDHRAIPMSEDSADIIVMPYYDSAQ